MLGNEAIRAKQVLSGNLTLSGIYLWRVWLERTRASGGLDKARKRRRPRLHPSRDDNQALRDKEVLLPLPKFPDSAET